MPAEISLIEREKEYSLILIVSFYERSACKILFLDMLMLVSRMSVHPFFSIDDALGSRANNLTSKVKRIEFASREVLTSFYIECLKKKKT